MSVENLVAGPQGTCSFPSTPHPSTATPPSQGSALSPMLPLQASSLHPLSLTYLSSLLTWQKTYSPFNTRCQMARPGGPNGNAGLEDVCWLTKCIFIMYISLNLKIRTIYLKIQISGFS